MTDIRPQSRQALYLSSAADFALFGGQAGGGKTVALLIEGMRHSGNKNFRAVFFRRTNPQIVSPGGMWDEASTLYPLVGAQPYNSPPMHWTFPSGAQIVMTHLQHEKDILGWQGSQVSLFAFDEITHFSRRQFFYMFSRNRSATSGVRPYIRATCNPVPPDDPVGGWVHEFVGWYINQDTGYAIPERSGVIRWFVNVNDELHWAEQPGDLAQRFPGIEPKSFTFVHSALSDNQILMRNDPGYLANLQALSLIEQEQLLRGNWLIKPAAGKVFNESWFEVVDAVPAGGWTVRFWDLAATEKELAKDDPDYTASCLMKLVDDVYYVMDATAEQMGPARTDKAIYNTATQDGKEVPVRWEREGGASGKRDTRTVATMLDGWDARGVRPQGDKLVRAKGLAAQAYAGNVKVLRGAWNKRWRAHMHGQPDLAHDDECLAAGTFVMTNDGDKLIEDIQAGDYVLTRQGHKRVRWAGMTNPSAKVVTAFLSDGRTLTGTPNHPLFTRENDVVDLDASRGYGIISVWQNQKPLSIKASNLGVIPTRNMSLIRIITDHIRGIFGLESGIFTKKYGKMQTGLFQKVTRYITRTGIRSTIVLKISNALPPRSTEENRLNCVIGMLVTHKRRISLTLGHLLRRGINQTREENGILNTPSEYGRIANQRFVYASSAAKSLKPYAKNAVKAIGEPSSVLIHAKSDSDTTISDALSKSNAQSAEKYFSDNGDKKTVPVHVVFVEDGRQRRPVYNLTVEDAPEYFANGILVHNCDSASGAYNELQRLKKAWTPGSVQG